MQPAIAIHGGAGVILREKLSVDLEKKFREGLQRALLAGYDVLKKNGSAPDAVQAAVVVMEDDPLFNAGRGAVMTHEGKFELDAALMDGATRRAGAIAGVHGVRNPVLLARAVMDKSKHVFLAGIGAEEFARENGIAFEDENYFATELRRNQWLDAKDNNSISLDHSDSSAELRKAKKEDEKKFGTVGAVACDVNGNLAAATSTGGMTNKRWGRVGDSPVIGAGTYADDVVAVSCTGHGEFFIRRVAAHEVAALMKYKSFSVQQACDEVIHRQLFPDGGEGGLIAVDRRGNIALPFNTPGMYRGFVNEKGEPVVLIFKES